MRPSTLPLLRRRIAQRFAGVIQGAELLSVSCSSCHGSLCLPSLSRSPFRQCPLGSPSIPTLPSCISCRDIVQPSDAALGCQSTSHLILSFEVDSLSTSDFFSFKNIVSDHRSLPCSLLLDFLPFRSFSPASPPLSHFPSIDQTKYGESLAWRPMASEQASHAMLALPCYLVNE